MKRKIFNPLEIENRKYKEELKIMSTYTIKLQNLIHELEKKNKRLLKIKYNLRKRLEDDKNTFIAINNSIKSDKCQPGTVHIATKN